LLEWGGRFEKKDNTRREIEMAQKYYFDLGGFQNDQRDITMAFAKAVGGSTNVYTGTSLKAPSHVFETWGVDGINLSELEPRYEKYIQENSIHLYPEEELNENNKLFIKACQDLGWHAEQFPVNTKGCQGLATCNLGCALHAKQGTAVVQIPVAAKKGVTVIPFCRVDRIDGSDVLAEVLPPEYGLNPSQLEVGQYRFKAKKIVVCGGAIHSPVILAKSFGEDFLPALGRYFTCHPALILVAQHERAIETTSGHPKSFFCDEFHRSLGFIFETCFYFPFTLAKNLVGFGGEVDELIRHYNHLQFILSLAIDEAESHNRVYLGADGKPHVNYQMSDKTIQSFVDSIKASTKIFFKAGAKRVHAPSMNKFFIYPEEESQMDKLITKNQFKLGKMSIAAAHLMGGCRMGTDLKTSVTNSWGKVHGKENLYVADASLFPKALEINPYLTIMALADRVSEGIKRDLGETA